MKLEIFELFKEKKNLKFYLIDRKEIKASEANELAKKKGMTLSLIIR